MKREIKLSCMFCKNLEVQNYGGTQVYCDLTEDDIDICDCFKVCEDFEFKEYRDIEKECTKECPHYIECRNSYLDFIENSFNCYNFECQRGCGSSFKSCDESFQMCPKCGFTVTRV